MTRVTPFRFVDHSLDDFARALRCGETTIAAAVQGCLERIARLDPALNAFTVVTAERASQTAAALDALLRSGTDLGPLMGVPIVLKDLFVVEAAPTTAGSRMDVADLVPPVGPVVRALERAGCVILGKTRTSEFALGGVNYTHPVPRNPWDMAIHRMPGGSSSGSAVAQAAGLCAIALGTDTGGSVRMPAALCGVVGHKFGFGTLSIDGIFPLSPTLDSPGVFANRVADAALVAATLLGRARPEPANLRGIRLGVPETLFFDDLDGAVDEAVRSAMDPLRAAGTELVPIDIGPCDDWARAFAGLIPVELAAILGRDRIHAQRDKLDPVARARLEGALDQSALEYLWARMRQRELQALSEASMRNLDGWIVPTSPSTATPLAECTTVDDAVRWNGRALRNTRPGNLFGQCAVSLPLPVPSGTLPVGLQIAGRNGDDLRILAIGAGIEHLLGTPARPEL